MAKLYKRQNKLAVKKIGIIQSFFRVRRQEILITIIVKETVYKYWNHREKREIVFTARKCQLVQYINYAIECLSTIDNEILFEV